MHGDRNSEQVFVSTLPGLEQALLMECQSLGFAPRAVDGGVEFTGPEGLHREANLRLRTASRVLLRVARFKAVDAEGLKRGLRAARLEFLWDGKAPIGLSFSAQRSRLHSEKLALETAAHVWPAAQLKKAPPWDEDETESFRLQLRVTADEAVLSVDTSGGPLHRRGYRQEVSHAPMRETLAAGILLLAGFDGCMPLYDPMCGSGTFLIEGAWMAQRRAPGWDRAFAFEHFASFKPAAWEASKNRARAEFQASDPASGLGADINAGALGTARRNARRAGVQLQLARQDLRTWAVPAQGPGLMVANPPYGKRVGDPLELPALYTALGAAVRGPFKDSRAALLVPEDERLLKALQLPDARRLPLRNGGLRCVLVLRGA